MYPNQLQISYWKAEAQTRYPDFELNLEILNSFQGWMYCLYFKASPNLRLCKDDPFFRLKPIWMPLEMLWRDEGKSEVDFIFGLFPDQSSVLDTLTAKDYGKWQPIVGFFATTALSIIIITALLKISGSTVQVGNCLHCQGEPPSNPVIYVARINIDKNLKVLIGSSKIDLRVKDSFQLPLSQSEVGLDKLPVVLKSLVKRQPRLILWIETNDAVSDVFIQRILSIARQAGVRKLAFIRSN